MRPSLVLVCAALALSFPAPGRAADAEKATVRVVWRYRPPEPSWVAATPLPAGDRVFVGVVHGSLDRYGSLQCLDAATGKPMWTFTNKGDRFRMKDAFSSPCLADGRIYIGEGFHLNTECRLFCVEAATGKKLWDYKTVSHTESTPCVVDGKVYFGAGDHGLHCADAKTGKALWKYQGDRGLHVDSNPLVVGGRVYAGAGVGDIYRRTGVFCLDAATGKEVWFLPTELPVWGMCALRDRYVYVPLGNGNFVESADKPAGAVLCLEAATGKRVWQFDVKDGVLTRVLADDGHVYFGSRDGHVYAVRRKDGVLAWKHDLGSPVVACPALVTTKDGATLYAVSLHGRLCALRPEAELRKGTPRLEWTFDVPKDAGVKAEDVQVYSSPVVVVINGKEGVRRRIYLGSGFNLGEAGFVYCLEETRERKK
jgi:outer membrane protein assembly factor BamB